jgi:hypothetical protein
VGRGTAIASTLTIAAMFCPGAGGADRAALTQSTQVRSTTSPAPAPPTLLCRLRPGEKRLPASRRHGLIGHLRQYPDLGLATPRERARAERLLATLVATARRQQWSDLRGAARAGYGTRTATRRPGDRSVHYFHSERAATTGRRVVLDPSRPKALIYANAPGQPLALVGAMWSTRDGERGPTPGGPITRWHSHVICLATGKRRGTQPPPSGTCPVGSRLVQGRREMMHVWFTGELRSAFAISAPEPELCRAGLLPRAYCKGLASR